MPPAQDAVAASSMFCAAWPASRSANRYPRSPYLKRERQIIAVTTSSAAARSAISRSTSAPRSRSGSNAPSDSSRCRNGW